MENANIRKIIVNLIILHFTMEYCNYSNILIYRYTYIIVNEQ